MERAADSPALAVKVPEPSTAELAYLAGIIDGEGHFATPKGAGPAIVCCMADVPILEWCHEHFTGSLSNEYTPVGNSRPRRMWQLQRQADLNYLLPLLAPFLVLKRDECDLALELVRHHLFRESRRLTPEWEADRERLRAAIRAAIRARK